MRNEEMSVPVFITKQFKTWTLVGPISLPRGKSMWAPIKLDAAAKVPDPGSFHILGQAIPVKKVKIDGPVIDFRIHLGCPAGRPQSYAFTELEIPRDGTLTLAYDADWNAAWWVDGKEVSETRAGNGGPVGTAEHPIMIRLKKGKHTIAVRVVSGTMGWVLIIRVVDWQPGVADVLRTDPNALWRDYTRKVVRYECRPVPNGQCGNMSKEQFESIMANSGVEARWISVVHNDNGSYYKSRYFPMWRHAKPGYERELKDWVKVLHQRRMAVMSWCPLSHCHAVWERHPSWRQQYLVPPSPDGTAGKSSCCINSPYGDALINYVIEALRKFDLDGFWFDGAYFTNINEIPRTISCVCPYCRKKFKTETGLEMPNRYDWSLPEFRRWVKWRYEMFSAYWQKLTDKIHKAVPQAKIVFNHYHRENIGWNSAIPLNPFGKNFTSGIEADGEPLRGAFYTRLMRAYERSDTEVWMGLMGVVKNTVRGPIGNPSAVLDFVLACATAGGYASVGGDTTEESLSLGEISKELKMRSPYLNLPSVPFVALHLSEQSETFVFGRNPKFLAVNWSDYYWNSLTGWHHLLAYAGFTCDVVFDAHLTRRALSRYPVLVMPLAPALNHRQFREIMRYVQEGGILITGPWFAACDEYGEIRREGLGDRFVFPFGRNMPSWDAIEKRAALKIKGRDSSSGKDVRFQARPLSSFFGNSVSLRLDGGNPIVKESRIGKGRIIQMAVDLGTLFRYSKAKVVVDSARKFIKGLASPLVEIEESAGLILGVFKEDNRDKHIVVHVQQFPLPWDTKYISRPPKMRWGTRLLWHGTKPESVRCCLPEPGPDLPVRKRGNAWEVSLPPFVRGQVVSIATRR